MDRPLKIRNSLRVFIVCVCFIFCFFAVSFRRVKYPTSFCRRQDGWPVSFPLRNLIVGHKTTSIKSKRAQPFSCIDVLLDGFSTESHWEKSLPWSLPLFTPNFAMYSPAQCVFLVIKLNRPTNSVVFFDSKAQIRCKPVEAVGVGTVDEDFGTFALWSNVQCLYMRPLFSQCSNLAQKRSSLWDIV